MTVFERPKGSGNWAALAERPRHLATGRDADPLFAARCAIRKADRVLLPARVAVASAGFGSREVAESGAGRLSYQGRPERA